MNKTLLVFSKSSHCLQEQPRTGSLIAASPESRTCQIVWNISIYFPSAGFRICTYDSVCNNNWILFFVLIKSWEMCDSSTSFFYAIITWIHVFTVTNFKRQINQNLQLPAQPRILTFIFFSFLKEHLSFSCCCMNSNKTGIKCLGLDPAVQPMWTPQIQLPDHGPTEWVQETVKRLNTKGCHWSLCVFCLNKNGSLTNSI